MGGGRGGSMGRRTLGLNKKDELAKAVFVEEVALLVGDK